MNLKIMTSRRGRPLEARKYAALRTTVMLMLILVLADIQWVRTSERLTVIYLLDQSLSIPPQHRRAMVEYVNASIREHREKEDRAAVIVFGRDAAIEIPPFDDDVQIPPVIESITDPENTNLAGAMRLAQASFPEDAAKRIVVVSDGNENLGDAIRQARALAGAGISIDVVPVHYQSRAEVIVERLTIPSDVRRGQPFDMRVVLSNSTQPRGDRSGLAHDVRGAVELVEGVDDVHRVAKLVERRGPGGAVVAGGGPHERHRIRGAHLVGLDLGDLRIEEPPR